MNYPDDRTMSTLYALTCGIEFSTFDDGEMRMKVPSEKTLEGYQWVLIPGECFDELIERGWVILVGADEFEVTQSGAWWVRRWWEKREKRRAVR